MRQLTNEEHNRIVEQYGDVFTTDIYIPTAMRIYRGLLVSAGVLNIFNPTYYAHRILLVYNIAYDKLEKQFYKYDKDTGIWETISKEKLLMSIDSDMHYYSESIPQINKHRSESKRKNIMNLLMGIAEVEFDKKNNSDFAIHCRNTMLMLETNDKILVSNIESNSNKYLNWTKEDFAPKFGSRNSLNIEYDANAKCPKFINTLLKPAMTEDDIETLQLYFGQCLLNRNVSQTFLLLAGTAGGGKSTLVNIIEGIVGQHNCTELRLNQLGRPFESGRFQGKSLLTTKEAEPQSLKYKSANVLKALTGNDAMTVEGKNSNSVKSIEGSFNIILITNASLTIKFSSDIEAWRRRLLMIRYDNPPPKKRITDLDKKLLKEEGSGILNWGLEGALKLLNNDGIITKSERQEKVITDFLDSCEPFQYFAKNFIHEDIDNNITINEVTTTCIKMCQKFNWPVPPKRALQKEFHEWMSSHYGSSPRHDIMRNGKAKRGYQGFIIKKK
ncbi:DUF5906 domain-containing protein [Lentisphaerota bacterium WC36G]|nr:DUF5906 domain-containing protein [Lentisphaerae bacterium WC36]